MNELARIQIDALASTGLCDMNDIDDVKVASCDMEFHYLNYLLNDTVFLENYRRYVRQNEKLQRRQASMF